MLKVMKIFVSACVFFSFLLLLCLYETTPICSLAGGFNNLHHSIIKPIRTPFLSSFSSLSNISPPIPNPNPNPSSIFNYLVQTFQFSHQLALSICNRYPRAKTLEKPQFFRNISDTHIRKAVRVTPRILFYNVENMLKTKLQYFQDMGVTDSDLGNLISNNSTLLAPSLDSKLNPFVEILKKILVNDDKSHHDLVVVLSRCTRLGCQDSVSRFLCNITFLESCGIVGPQLSNLLKRRPRIFLMEESAVRNLVSRAVDMGFSIPSRMLVHAIDTLGCISNETIAKKFDLFRSFGFSSDECTEMFWRSRALFNTSVDKLAIGIDFFFNVIKLEKSEIVHRPFCLMISMEERVIPRYRVLQIMQSKRLLTKEPSFVAVLRLTKEDFLEKYISRFGDDAEELLVAYKGHLLDSSAE